MKGKIDKRISEVSVKVKTFFDSFKNVIDSADDKVGISFEALFSSLEDFMCQINEYQNAKKLYFEVPPGMTILHSYM